MRLLPVLLLWTAISLACSAENRDVGEVKRDLKLTKPIVMVYLNGSEDTTYVIRNPFFAEVQGKQLLVGTGAKWHNASWDNDLEIWIDWASVRSMIQFDSIEQCMERIKR